MTDPTHKPSVWINFYDIDDGDIAVVLKTANQINKPEDRTPAQKTAYEVLKIFSERASRDGDQVKSFLRHGDMTEYVVGKP